MRGNRIRITSHKSVYIYAGMFRMVKCVALWIFLPRGPGSPHRWSLVGEEGSV